MLGRDDQGSHAMYLYVPLEGCVTIKKIKQARLYLYLTENNADQQNEQRYQIIPTNQTVNPYSKNDIVPLIWNQPDYIGIASIKSSIFIMDISELVKKWVKSPRRNYGMIVEPFMETESVSIVDMEKKQTCPYIYIEERKEKKKEKKKENRKVEVIGSIKGIKQF